MSRDLPINANNQPLITTHQSRDSFLFLSTYMCEKEIKVIFKVCTYVCLCVLSLSICISIISLVKFFHAEFHSPYLCMHLYVVKTIHRHTYVHTLFLFIFKISPLEAWILKSFASGESVFGTKTFTCPISTCRS